MRFLALAACVLCSASALAERLIFIPTAKKLTSQTLFAEGFYSGGEGRWEGGYLAAGYGVHLEGAFRYDHFGAGHGAETVDFSYHLLSPVGDFAPGLAAGVQDALGTTADGRRFFVCTTMNSAALTSLRHTLYAQGTVGFAVGKTGAPFAGISVPLGASIRVLAEHDGLRFSTGFEITPYRGTSLRLVVRDGSVLGAVGVYVKL